MNSLSPPLLTSHACPESVTHRPFSIVVTFTEIMTLYRFQRLLSPFFTIPASRRRVYEGKKRLAQPTFSYSSFLVNPLDDIHFHIPMTNVPSLFSYDSKTIADN